MILAILIPFTLVVEPLAALVAELYKVITAYLAELIIIATIEMLPVFIRE